MNQTLLVLTLVLLVVASARMLPEPWSAEVGAVRNLKGGELPRRRRSNFHFRGYWSCPIGYIRSPAAFCVECGEYEMITGMPCDSIL
ncbi:PREDICTED: uncharacterized protein LOC106099991 [Papilio polytes]|uniref:uncharacterized protein LOC106099991 n=1 Tax=Papilio polytes TaxID=76194 RepID=UPI0006763D22|nr:PREDICTED: uncharacterized protein LOC106099991 [Papilio polytes]